VKIRDSESKNRAGELMVKLTQVLAIIALAATTVLAQNASKKKAADSESNGPTKVTGQSTKLPDGLQYWDWQGGQKGRQREGELHGLADQRQEV
jgi:hypothetical protein